MKKMYSSIIKIIIIIILVCSILPIAAFSSIDDFSEGKTVNTSISLKEKSRQYSKVTTQNRQNKGFAQGKSRKFSEERYSIKDMQRAYELCAFSDKSAEELLKAKGKFSKFITNTKTNKDGSKTDVILGEDGKMWDEVLKELNIDLYKAAENYGVLQSDIEEMKTNGLKQIQIYDIAVLAANFDKDYKVVKEEYLAVNSDRIGLESKYLREINKIGDMAVPNEYINNYSIQSIDPLKNLDSAAASSTLDPTEENAKIYNNSMYPLSSYKVGVVPGSVLENTEKEYIDTVTGDLNLSKTDLYLKGKNGFDFALTRYYSSSQCNIYENQVSLQSNASGSLSFCDVVNINTFNDRFYDIGAGWAFDFPYLELREGYLYLHYGKSGVWPIQYDTTSGNYIIKDYALKDITIELDNSRSFSSGGHKAWFILKQKDGKKYYFSDGQSTSATSINLPFGMLIGIADRYDNEIKLEYTEKVDTYGMNHYLISKIIDSCQRIVNFTYENETNRVKVSLSDGSKTIYYNKARIKDKRPDLTNIVIDTESVLDSVTNEEGKITAYEYDIKSAKASLLSKNVDTIGVTNYYTCLQRVIYPTQAGRELYLYNNISTKNCGKDGARQFYKISQRTSSSSEYGGLPSNSYNSISYTYREENTGEADGYPNYAENVDIPDGYTTKTIESKNTSAGFVNKKYTYNKNLLCQNILETGDNHKTEIINEYDTKKQLIKTISKLYNLSTSTYMEKVQNFSFNDFRDLVGYWGELAQRNSSNIPINDEYKIAHSYNPIYHYITSKSFKKDAATTIVETYVPSSDEKKIDSMNIAENGVVKKKSSYQYDTYGNITEQKNYFEDWTNFISVKYEYTDSNLGASFNGAFLTKKKIEGIKNADDNIVGNIEENYKYDYYGNLLEKCDSMGNITKYEYDIMGRKTKEINPDLSYRTWAYALSNTENSIILRDENYNNSLYSSYGSQIKYGYDALGHLMYERDMISDKNIKSTTYYTDGKIESETDKYGTRTNYSYRSDGRLYIKEIKDKNNSSMYKETYEYEEANSGGLYIKIAKTIFPFIKTISYVNKAGLIERQEQIDEYNNPAYQSTVKYDYIGNKIEEKNSRAYKENWTNEYTAKYEYDYAGRVVKQYDVNNDFSTVKYDAIGRITEKTDNKGNKAATKYSSQYKYDALGNLIEEKVPFELLNGTIYYSTKKNYYDKNGNVVQIKTSKNKINEGQDYDEIQYEYDNRNRLIKVTTYDNGLPENYTQYYYDASGNKIRMYTGLKNQLKINGLDNITSSGDDEYSVTKYDYDRYGRLKKLTDPLGQIETYTYDIENAEGKNIEQKTDRNGNIATTVYDGLRRALFVNVIDAQGKTTASNAYTYNYYGARESMTNNGITINYTYDRYGRLKKEEAPGKAKEYEYDAGNNIASETIKINGAVQLATNYTYDKLSRLRTVNNGPNTTAIYDYDENGNRTGLTYGNEDRIYYCYNLANRLMEIKNCYNKLKSYSDYTYTYYLNGNQSSKTDHLGKVTEYVYDGLGRLINETEKTNDAINTNVSYMYDESNNRKTMTNNGVITNYTYDKNNRLLTENKTKNGIDEITNYVYDNNGNQIYKATDILKGEDISKLENIGLYLAGENVNSTALYSEYDGLSKLVKTYVQDKTVVYTYDGDGKRVSKAVNGLATEYVWGGKNVVLELDSAGAVAAKYVYGINLIYNEDGAGDKKWYLYNGHGDVVQITDVLGNAVKSYDYDAWGNEISIDSNDNNAFRYCGSSGYVWDKETGIYYVKARYYDQTMGRFISEDSFGGKITDPLSLNRYTYCEQNPVNFTDPTGHYKKGDENLPLTDWEKNELNWLGNSWASIQNNSSYSAKEKAIRQSGLQRQADAIRAQYIDRAIVINNTASASGAGHSGVTLMNSAGQGFLFSYNPTISNAKTLIGVDGEMRFKLLTPDEASNLFYGDGKVIGIKASDGDTGIDETYNRFAYISTSNDNGYNMFKKGMSIYDKAGTYILEHNNCTTNTADILHAGNASFSSFISPNIAFYNSINENKYYSWQIFSKGNWGQIPLD